MDRWMLMWWGRYCVVGFGGIDVGLLDMVVVERIR